MCGCNSWYHKVHWSLLYCFCIFSSACAFIFLSAYCSFLSVIHCHLFTVQKLIWKRNYRVVLPLRKKKVLLWLVEFVGRDLKPGNVMMTDDKTPVVMDLGSAAKARMEIRNLREATTLQVYISSSVLIFKKHFTLGMCY